MIKYGNEKLVFDDFLGVLFIEIPFAASFAKCKIKPRQLGTPKKVNQDKINQKLDVLPYTYFFYTDQ